MERAQDFAGSFKSKAHQLNGNKFYGPVSFSATGERDESHTASSESPIRVHDMIDGIPGSGQSGILNWDECLQSLAFDESNDRERAIETQSAGTCEWLMKSPEYLRWVDEHGLLLIRGKPGCGKSTLLKFVLGQQTEAAAPLGSIVLSFFFYASGTDLQRSILGFFQSLLLQLLDQDEYSRPEFMKICRKYCKPREKLQLKWQQVELEAHFQKLVVDCSARRKILIFVDALDECSDNDRDRLISFIHGLRDQIKSRLNRPGICVTCRPYPDGQIKADFQVRLEEENQDDIESFVGHKLRLPDESVTDTEELKRTLLGKADGLFLWLALIIPQIHNMSAKGLSMRRIKSELLECPQELDRLYEGLLGDIQDDELLEACTLFQWVCFAIRSLSLGKLRIAMTVHLSGSKGSLREYEDGDNPQLIPSEAKMRKRMIHLSRGLVDIGSAKLGDGKAIVGFHHDTIRDFMLRKGLSYLNGRLHEPRSLTQIASVQLANTCLQYLSTEEICLACQEREIFSRERFQFLGYAASCWVSHAVTAERQNLGEEIAWPTETILGVWINACRKLENSSSKTAIEGTSLMHIAAEFGLQKLAKRIMCTKEQKVSTISSHRKLIMGDTSKSAARQLTTKASRKGGQVKVNRIPPRTQKLQLSTSEEAESRRKSDAIPKQARERAVSSETVKVRRGVTRETAKVGFKTIRGKGSESFVNTQNNKGDSPLHLAAKHGSLEMVIFLCEWGSKTTQPNYYGLTPLYRASSSGHLEIVKFLYEHGADVHTATKDGWTPLYAASDSGHFEIVKFLCEHGADVHTATKYGWTPLCVASDSGHLEMVKLLYEHGADIHTATKDCWNPLSAASDSGHLEIVKFLYEHGADVHTATKDGWTPLCVASDSGHLEIVKFLYEHGSDVHTATQDGWTPLSEASDSGHLEIVKFLYEHGSDVHTATKDGWTALSAASSSGHLEVVKFLWEHGGATVHTPIMNDGWTPLSLASYSGHLKVVKFLYDHGADADIHTATKDGWTPLSVASYSGHLEVVRFLYDHGADTDIHTATNNGRTPLHAASDSGHLEVVRFLYDHGADTDIHTAKNNGQTPLHAASDSGHLEVVKFLYDHGADADIHTATKDGWTPLSGASYSGHLEVVRFLYDHGADTDIHTATNNGQTPLHAASDSGHLEVVKFLYDHGADADIHTATKDDGWTPLSVASYSGHLEVVKFLCENGARVETSDSIGRTPLFLASVRSHTEVVQQLLSQGAMVDIKDRYGYTPLFAAVGNGHETAVMCLLTLQGTCIQFEDSFGHTLLWWARKSGNAKVSEAVIQFTKTRGIKVSDGDLAVEASSMATGGSTTWWCDVCTRFISIGRAYHQCSICLGGGFVVCLECFEMGARCLNGSHELVWEEPVE
ncbi:Ankyrin repeat-containing domain [Penicillium camemberti]|uniref:Ankyrin repeat-containing domain n=1 Tax=Penicillium camemberti (strain FM 013) TaxID=1429867 RepID=A0A0G4PG28_PENC3|nr:Ankyrin repeat-containing domain [Penicillium camemberti]